MPASRVYQAALLLAALVTGAAADPPCGSACTDICAPDLSDCTGGQEPTDVSGTCVCACPSATPDFSTGTCDACPSGTEWDPATSMCAETGPPLEVVVQNPFTYILGTSGDLQVEDFCSLATDSVFFYRKYDLAASMGLEANSMGWQQGGFQGPDLSGADIDYSSPQIVDIQCTRDEVSVVKENVEVTLGCPAGDVFVPLIYAELYDMSHFKLHGFTSCKAECETDQVWGGDTYGCIAKSECAGSLYQDDFATSGILICTKCGTEVDGVPFGSRPYSYGCQTCPEGEDWDNVAQSCAATSPINCVGSWGACDASCKSTYSVTTSAANGGAACPASHQAQVDCDPTDSSADTCMCAFISKEQANDGSCHDECSGTGKIFDPTGSGSCVCDPSNFPNVDNSGSCYDACAYDNTGVQLVFNPELSQCECPSDTYMDQTGICVSVFQANEMDDEVVFLSGVDDLGFSDAPADHCQGGDPSLTSVSFRYQDSTDTRSFTAATLKAHLDTLEAGSVNLKVVCDFGPGQSASDDFTVTITCGAADVDGDGVCDHNDACAGVQCQAFYALLPQAGSTIQFAAVGSNYYNIVGPTVEVVDTNRNIEICAGTHTVQRTDSGHALQISESSDSSDSGDVVGTISGDAQLPIAFVAGETYNYVCTSHSNMHGVITVVDCASPYTCVDTDVDTNNGDYQCQQEGHEHELCGGRGFTGADCGTCAAGSGWNGDDADPQCVSCADSGEKYHTNSDSPTEPCVLAHCAEGHGVTKDSSFSSTAAAGDNCVPCDEGFKSDAGSGWCEPKTCVKGDGIAAGTIVCDQGTVSGETGSCGCTCDAGYEGDNCVTASACVVASAENLNSGEIACLHGGLATGTTGGCGCNCGDIDYSGDRCQTRTDNCDPDPCKNGATCSDYLNDYECSPARGFSGKDNDVCADGKQEVSNICMTKQADGKAPAGDITLVKSLHGGTAPAQRKARKQAVRDALREARKDVDDALLADKKKGGQPAFIWLQDYAVDLDEDNDYADDSATKAKFKALPAESTLKMVVGFSGDSEVVVSARPRKSKKGEPVDVERVVLATPTSTAVLGIMTDDDGTDAIPTAKFTGNGVDAGYDWKCRGDADNWVDPVGGTTKQDGDTVECPIARGEPVARTFDVGSGEEQTTACKQENAENYLGTAIYHDQTLCCVVDGCSKQQLSDAFAAKSSGCGDNAGGHTEDVDGNCQTTQCEQAQLFDAYESGTCARR